MLSSSSKAVLSLMILGTVLAGAAAEEKGPIQVPARRDGVIRQLLVREGDPVQEGQLLARLDSRLAAVEVKIRKTRLVASQTELGAAEKIRAESFQRLEVQRQIGRRCGCTEDVRAAELTFARYLREANAAQAKVQLAERELEYAKILLDLYTIRSPAAGVVQEVRKQRGEAVREYDTVFLIRPVEKP